MDPDLLLQSPQLSEVTGDEFSLLGQGVGDLQLQGPSEMGGHR